MMKICGVVQSGEGRGAFFTQVDWVVKQCEDTLGYRPFPGTLNVHICGKDLDKLEQFLASTDGSLVPDDPGFCTAQVKMVRVNDIPAAIVLPSEDVRIHGHQVIEIIASQNLKEALCLEDGDTVTLSEGE